MNKALVSFGYGPHKELLDFAEQSFKKYGDLHSYDYIRMDEEWLTDIKSHTNSNRPYSWYKLFAINDLFTIGYESILWLDADVIIKDYTEDIMELIKQGSNCGVILHNTPDGSVPNLGVWVLKNKPIWFDDLWNITKYHSNNYWWEQASFISLLGINPDIRPLKITEQDLLNIGCQSLPYEYNPHKNDVRGIPRNLKFFHSTMYKNRLEAMKNAVL